MANSTTYSVRAYNMYNLYNYPSPPLPPSDILLTKAPTTSRIEAEVDSGGVINSVVMIGSWGAISGNPQTFEDLMNTPGFFPGTVTQVMSYQDGVLTSIEEYAGVNILTWIDSEINGSQAARAEIFGGNNIFYSSSTIPQNGWSDGIYGYAGSNNTYYVAHPDLDGNDDSVVGAPGSFNTTVMPGQRANFSVTTSDNIWNSLTQTSSLNGYIISSIDGEFNPVALAGGIQRVQFTDINLALDIGPTQNAGSVYMLYKAAFNRAPDEGGMGYWLAQKDGGANIVTDIAQGFVNSGEFTAKYGTNPTNASYVDKLYLNVLGRAGEAGGVAYWNQELNAGNISKAAVLVQFATLAEGASIVAPLIANGIAYTEWVG
jgi:hypothetical protein